MYLYSLCDLARAFKVIQNQVTKQVKVSRNNRNRIITKHVYRRATFVAIKRNRISKFSVEHRAISLQQVSFFFILSIELKISVSASGPYQLTFYYMLTKS